MKFVGDRLRLSRTYRGWTTRVLAELVSVSATFISQIERDQKEPQETLVEALAIVLGFESAFFYRPLVDEFTQKECSFRKRATTPQKVKDRLLAQGTLLAELIAELQAVVRLPDCNIPRFEGSVWGRDALEEAAHNTRAYWGFGEGPISNMVRVLEHAGVIVVRLHDESDRVDAFSRTSSHKKAVPFVILNDAKGSSSRARMDKAHELGHLVLHNGATTKDQELQADQFGAAFLLPEGAFGRSFKSLGPRLNWPEYFELKRHWGVSVAMLVRRAFDLRLIDAVEYRRRFKYIRYRGWHRGEPLEPLTEEPELIMNAVTLGLLNKRSNVGRLLGALGWTRETFTQLTGVSLPDVSARDPTIIPLDRARLSLA